MPRDSEWPNGARTYSTTPQGLLMDPLDPGNTQPHYDQDIIQTEAARYTLAVIQAICMILASIGNGFVIYFILKYRKSRRNATAFLILNLAVCDFISASIQQPMRLVDILLPFEHPDLKMNNWGSTYCKITGFNSTLISCTGFLTVVAIAIERYLLICHPLKAKVILTQKNVRLALLIVWLISLLTTLPLPIKYTYVAHAHFEQVNVTICMQDLMGRNTSSGSEYYMFIFVIYFIIPVLIITLAYSKVFYVLHSKVSMVETENEVSRKVMRARKRLAKMMLCIGIIFTALHGPFFVTFLLIACGVAIPHNPIFAFLLLETLMLINAVINPFVYSANSRTFFRKKMVSFMGGQYEESSVYRRKSASTREQEKALMNSFRKSNLTDTTSLRTCDSSRNSSRPESINTSESTPVSRNTSFNTGSEPVSRNTSFRTHDTASMTSNHSDTYRCNEELNNTKDSSFSQDERIPLTQIEEEMETSQVL